MLLGDAVTTQLKQFLPSTLFAGSFLSQPGCPFKEVASGHQAQVGPLPLSPFHNL